MSNNVHDHDYGNHHHHHHHHHDDDDNCDDDNYNARSEFSDAKLPFGHRHNT